MALAGSAGMGCAAGKLVTFVKFVGIWWGSTKFPTFCDYESAHRRCMFVDLSSGSKLLMFPRLGSDASSRSIRDFIVAEMTLEFLHTPTIMQDVQRFE
jgi:hypothetical protein